MPQSLESVARNAALACDADEAIIELVDGATRRRVAHYGAVPSAATDRVKLVLPLNGVGAEFGMIEISRAQAVPFDARQGTLLQAFADQAALTIENTRLLEELDRTTQDLILSAREVHALSEVSRAVSSSLDLQVVLDTIVGHAVKLSDSEGCGIYELDASRNAYDIVASFNLSNRFLEAVAVTPIGPRGSVLRRASARGEAIQVPDVLLVEEVHARDALLEEGFRSLLAVPMGSEDALRGILLYRRPPGRFDARVVNLLTAFASQSTVAIHNARLFREIEQKSSQLEVASRHKSEFLANMSHELRAPLSAVIGYSEMLLEQVFGQLNAKQTQYLESILASSRHQLSLINDILDLSKVEAGRVELDLSTFYLPDLLDHALMLVRGPANRYGVAVSLFVDQSLGAVTADERKIKQILLNLLSNALKFTPQGGRVELRAMQTAGVIEVAVCDTGIGIAPEDQEIIFEEFRRAGGDEARKREGTGLGLSLARKFVLLHGGSIGVRSELGNGSTFTFTLPAQPSAAR
jgi:signal transduction histidine kinase